MNTAVFKLFRKSGLLAVSSILMFSATFATIVTLTQASSASASQTPGDTGSAQSNVGAQPCNASQSTDKDTNILYDGLGADSASAESLRSSLQGYFNGSTAAGNCYTDAQAVFSRLGLTSDMLNNTSGWVKGSTNSDGTITVDGTNEVVATGAQVTSRCFTGLTNCTPDGSNGYTKLLSDSSSNVYTHPTAWYTDATRGSVKTLIYRDNTGKALFAIFIHCGNAMGFTAKPPVQSLDCKNLITTPSDQDDSSITYNFTVTADVVNVKNITYTLDYGNGDKASPVVVTNGASTATFTNKFTKLETDKTYTATAQVNNQPQVSTCKTDFKVPGKNKLTFACSNLDAVVTSRSTGSITYLYTAHVSGTDTSTPPNFQFFTSDTTQPTDLTSNATYTHTYTLDTSKAQTFNAHFFAKSAHGLTTDDNDSNCKKQFSTATVLSDTGPAGTLGLFAAASTGGTLLYQFIARRKLSA